MTDYPLPRWEYDEHRFLDAPRTGGVFPVPPVSWDDAPVYRVRFGGAWLGAVVGVLSALDQYDAWQGTDEQIFDARQAVREIIASIELDAGSLMLRQNDENSCLLEQSLDGGETWSLAFDYSLCVPATINDILQIVNQTRITQIEDFTLLEINNNAPTLTWVSSSADTDSGNNERAEALCALAQWVAVGSTEMLAQIQEDEITFSNVAAAALGIGVGVISLLVPAFAIVGAVKWITLGAVFSAGGFALYSELSGADVTLLRDPDIREFLACEIYKDLQSKPVTEDSLATFLSGDYSCFTSDERRAVSLIRQMFVLTDRRRQLLNAMVDYLGDVTAAQKSGILGASCICDTGSWTHSLDLAEWFALTETGDIRYGGSSNRCADTIITGDVGGVLGGTGLWASEQYLGGQGLARKLRIFVPSGTVVTGIAAAGSLTQAVGGTALNIRVNSARACQQFFAGVASAGLTDTWSGEIIEIEVSVYAGSTTTPEVIRVSQLNFSGTGVSLFGGC